MVVYLSLIVGAAILADGAGPSTAQEQSALPKNVTEITVELFGFRKGDLGPPPPFTVPSDWNPVVLWALGVPKAEEYPESWDKMWPYGELVLTTKDGKKTVVRFCGANALQHRLCYQINGKRYVRGGEYKPVFVRKRDRYELFEYEARMLDQFLRWLGKPQSTPNRGAKLRFAIDRLKRSRGELPPEEGTN
jgi:hypothetical protein